MVTRGLARRSAQSFSQTSLRQAIGIVPQDTCLFNDTQRSLGCTTCMCCVVHSTHLRRLLSLAQEGAGEFSRASPDCARLLGCCPLQGQTAPASKQRCAERTPPGSHLTAVRCCCCCGWSRLRFNIGYGNLEVNTHTHGCTLSTAHPSLEPRGKTHTHGSTLSTAPPFT